MLAYIFPSFRQAPTSTNKDKRMKFVREKVCYFEVVFAHFDRRQYAEERRQEDWDKSGDAERHTLRAPVHAHQQQHVATCSFLNIQWSLLFLHDYVKQSIVIV